MAVGTQCLISAVSDRAAANQRSDIQPANGVEAGTEAEHWPMKTCSIRAIPPTITAGPMRFEQAEGGRGMACADRRWFCAHAYRHSLVQVSLYVLIFSLFPGLYRSAIV